MKEALRYGLTLAIICIVASGLLSGVNSLTRARIIAQAQAEEENALKEVMPQGEHFEPVKIGEDVAYYKVSDKENKLIGFAFKASGKGYSGTVDTLAGMHSDGKISAIKILNQSETPGLGTRVTEPSFTGRFANKSIQDLSGVTAVTGATISSRAVINSVKKRAEEVRALLKNER